jgi:hypothetical protein
VGSAIVNQGDYDYIQISESGFDNLDGIEAAESPADKHPGRGQPSIPGAEGADGQSPGLALGSGRVP